MRALLTSPNAMSLSDSEQSIYQTALTYVADLSLNLMAVKVENHPTDFINWCKELHYICQHRVNHELLEPEQVKPLKKLSECLVLGTSVSQLKMARVLPWPVFAGFVKDNASLQALDERLALLTYINTLKETPLDALSEEDRLTFAGKHTAQHDPGVYKFDVEWFAGTKGAKVFHQLLKDNPQAFDEALAHIPLDGDVEQLHYLAFVNAYKDIFNRLATNEKAPLAPATRLLAMRRPDQFIALTNAKIDAITQGLGVVKLNNQSFDDYWQELILTMRECPWWKASKPDLEHEDEITLWENRAVLVDLFLFADSTLAENSNYIRLRDKPKKASTSSSRGVKRTKESAEQLVDKALASDDVPEFVKNMRSTIVKSVQDGKTVEQAIGLMRSIFG